MTPSEYRYQIEKIYSECVGVSDWLITDDQFNQFVLMAKNAGSGNLVLENWKIYLSGSDGHDDFFEWWMKYRPDKLDSVVEENIEQPKDSKKSPFAAVKNRVGMGVRIE